MRYFLLIVLFSFGAETALSQTYIDYYREGSTAKKEGNFELFLSSIQKADSLRPNHPTILYNLASAYSLNQDVEMAFQTLEKRISFNTDSSFITDEDFRNVLEDGRVDKLRDLIRISSSTQEFSSKVFSISEKGFHPEGITYDELTNSFLISDVHEGKVVSYSRAGVKNRTIINLSEEGYWGAFGIAIDPNDKNILWITTSALPQFKYFKDGDEGKAALLKVEAKSGEILQVFLPKEDGNHMFGDLTISTDGTIYITDSMQPYIYSLKVGDTELSLFIENDTWWNLQGVAISEDNSTLYVSDYILGVYTVDVSTKSDKPVLLANKNVVTRGSDGIYRIGNKLVLLQNGTRPIRISSLELETQSKSSEQRFALLDRAVEGISEPTLGVVVNDELYFISNSPWAFYTDDSKPKLDEWPIINIYKLSFE